MSYKNCQFGYRNGQIGYRNRSFGYRTGRFGYAVLAVFGRLIAAVALFPLALVIFIVFLYERHREESCEAT